MTPSYDRVPSDMLRKQLLCGPLRPLLSMADCKVAGCHLDVHLRVRDEVHVYCGLTRPVGVRLDTKGDIHVFAAKSYLEQECSRELFGVWRRGTIDSKEFGSRLTEYLNRVDVGCRWVRREGRIQAAWSRIGEPWVPFDREAVLGYRSTADRDRARCFKEVHRARKRIEDLRMSEGWARLPGRGGEVDQLAVDPNGRLVVIELKDASSSSGVYYAPLQLLQYVWEWHSAFDAIRDSMQRLLDARVALKLTSPGVARIGTCIRPVVGFGADTRSKEVRRRYSKVLQVVNDHLPPGVVAVETWALEPIGRVD